jgi:hypothetical protein
MGVGVGGAEERVHQRPPLLSVRALGETRPRMVEALKETRVRRVDDQDAHWRMVPTTLFVLASTVTWCLRRSVRWGLRRLYQSKPAAEDGATRASARSRAKRHEGPMVNQKVVARVYPSRYTPFGLRVVEPMARGCLVIRTPLTSPRLAAAIEAAPYVHPDVRRIHEALARHAQPRRAAPRRGGAAPVAGSARFAQPASHIVRRGFDRRRRSIAICRSSRIRRAGHARRVDAGGRV